MPYVMVSLGALGVLLALVLCGTFCLSAARDGRRPWRWVETGRDRGADLRRSPAAVEPGVTPERPEDGLEGAKRAYKEFRFRLIMEDARRAIRGS